MMPPTPNLRRRTPSVALSDPPLKKRKIHETDQNYAPAGAAQVKCGESSPAKVVPQHGHDAETLGTWFNHVNRHGQPERAGKVWQDEEPPFYMASQEPYPNQASSPAPSTMFGGVAAPVVPTDSEKEDLRDVIDDLTVEIKKLKEKLRSNKTRPAKVTSGDAQDKLIEVRVHGLRAEKKRELEALLKNFAATLDKDHVPSRSSISRSSDPMASLSSPSQSIHGLAQHRGQLVPTDSGYGSNSNAGTARHTVPIPSTSKDHTINSYLHDIPDFLLPQDRHPMSDTSKMSLVVRRLEQLFTGNKATPGDHHQSMQQQEVSKSAAHADRQEDLKYRRKGPLEGAREAHILPANAHLNLDVSETASPLPSINTRVKLGERDVSVVDGIGNDAIRCNSPDQRPTRPLDLDIGRAQVAKENLEYIRHLHLPASSLDQADASASEWIYLNLLMSMAQIHTINVTPDFVRRAIRKRSTKLELSKDQCQVRWKGGTDGTNFSKETERAMERTTTMGFDLGHSSSIGSKDYNADSGSNGRISLTPSDDQGSREDKSNDLFNRQYSTLGTSYSSKPQGASSQGKPSSSFEYKPLFHKQRLPLRHGASSTDDTNSSAATESSGLIERISRSKVTNRSQNGEGILTFFHNAFFCSDLSADRHSTMAVRSNCFDVTIEREGILGVSQSIDFEESALRHHDACYFTPQFATKFTPPKNSTMIELGEDAFVAAGEAETEPMDMEVCGLGMIVPADNFAVDVKIARRPCIEERHLPRPLRTRFQSSVLAKFQYRVESARYIDLLPSRLPSPTYPFFTSSSSSGLDALDEDENAGSGSRSSSAAGEIRLAGHAFRRPYSKSSSNRGSEDEMEDDEMEDDDSSVDLLQAARAQDPERTAAQERDYLLHHPGAAMTVAPSLAATVGTLSVQDVRRRDRETQDIQAHVDEAVGDSSDED